MIDFLIENSPDYDMLGHHLYYHDKIVIGRHQGDILIDDPEIQNFHLKLHLSDKGLYSENLEGVKYYHVNGKRINGTKLVGPSDQIKIGSTVIKIKNFLYDKDMRPAEIIKKNIAVILEEDSPINAILDILESDLKKYS